MAVHSVSCLSFQVSVCTVKPSMWIYFHTLLLIWIIYHTPVTGQQVIGSSQIVLAKVDDDVILCCHIEPPVDMERKTVEWSRPDLKPEFVHVLQDGRFVHQSNPLYKQRTFLFAEKLSHGNISLKLSRVKLSDEGTYKCFAPTLKSSSSIQLRVGAVSQPVISLIGSKDDVLSWTCDSGCWFPEPEMFWLDSDGNNITAEFSVTEKPSTPFNPQHCYVVQRNVTVTRGDHVTCRVQLPHINYTVEIQPVIPESIFVTGGTDETHLASWVTAVIIGLLVAASVAAIFFWWKKQKQKQKSNKKVFMELEKLIERTGGGLPSLETDAEKACFLTQHKIEILLNVHKVKEIVDHLQIDDDNRATILKEKDSRSKMWALYATVIGPGTEKTKALFYDALKEYEPNVLEMPVSQSMETLSHEGSQQCSIGDFCKFMRLPTCVKMEDENASGSSANPTPTERAYLLSCPDSPTKKYLLIPHSASFHPSSTGTGSVSFNMKGEASAPTINIPDG